MPAFMSTSQQGPRNKEGSIYLKQFIYTQRDFQSSYKVLLMVYMVLCIMST